MPEIRISRDHSLGLAQARKLAFRWAETAEQKLGMECTYEEGKAQDVVSFTRAGANGELKVTKDRFELEARLGFLLGAFRERIEGEIVKNLDLLLAQKEPLKAFDEAIARRAAQRKPAPAARKAARKKA
ncbi:MAG TPA: polyhydroxyalkanoic acid system family protein [Ramlibacter sp.]|nr:polyhydroxyalkanoic acid system family protein [Ramlibacter sp.]